jgi:hypothetical protein
MESRFVRLMVVFLIVFFVFSELRLNLTGVESAETLASPSCFFTENKGQWDSSILFVGNTSFGKVAFTKDAVYYQMVKSVEKTYETQLVKLSFVSPQLPKVQGEGLLTNYNNYFIGNDSSKWASYCRNFEKIEYLDVWEGIDLAYFFTPEGLKYEYYISPQANVQDIQIRVEGAELATSCNSLEISTELGNIQDANLKVFDQTTQQTIPSRFQIQDNIISFTGIPEKRQNTVVIDPLIWSTYLGGSKGDYAHGIAVDEKGFVYICGGTESSDFPIVKKPNGKNNDDTYDGIITKLNPTGTDIIFTTFLGGNDLESADNIALDNDGNIYVSGSTNSKDFPTSVGAMQEKLMGEREIFITKLNNSGINILFSTFLGGSETDTEGSLAIDKDGNSYISGYTGSKDFPVSIGVLQNKLKGEYDMFVSKINPTGTGLVFSTFFGGSEYEGVFENGMAIDRDGNVYICGDTDSKNFPVTPGTIQKDLNGRIDSFVAKINSEGTSILYSTYLGGSEHETAAAVTVDLLGNTYICGRTDSPDFPVTKDSIQKEYIGSNDAFVTKINPDGTSILYSSYLGGDGWETAVDLIADNDGNVTVCGRTASLNFPITPDSYQPKMSGNNDCFLTKINTKDNKLIYSTFFGGSKVIERYENADEPWDITSDTSGNIYLCGSTQSNDFPITEGTYQPKNKGKQDGFVLKFDFGLGNTPPDSTPPILEIISPEDNSSTTDEEIIIKAKIYDEESGIDSITMNKGEKPEILVYDQMLKTYIWLYPIKKGVNNLKINVTNGAKLTSTKTLKVKRIDPDLIIIELWVDKPQAFIDGKPYVIDVPPMVRAARTQVPLRFISEGLKATVTYDAKTQKILIQYKSTTITLQIYNPEVLIEKISGEIKISEKTILEMAPYIYKGRTMVPVRFISEAFGAKVEYGSTDRSIVISMKR